MKKNRFIGLLMTGVMTLSVCACSGGGGGNTDSSSSSISDDGGLQENTQVTLEFFGWGDAEERENYQTLINQFMEDNPNITVVYSGESSTTYMTTLRNKANNLPDVFYMPDENFLEWASNGMLLDITDYVEEETLSGLWEQAVDEYYFDMDTMQLGKSESARLYGLPKDLGPFTLVYNKTLLDSKIVEYGLNRDEIYGMLSATEPMTWAEFRTLLKKVDPDGGADGVYGISHYELEAAVYSNDANFFNEDASQQTITDANFYDAVQFIVDLCTVDHVMPTADDQVSTNGYQRFKGNGCIFSFMGPWDCASFWKTVNFDYDILPVPYNGENENAVSTAWVGSMGYCLDAKIGSRSKVEAAIKLITYLCADEDGQRKFYELGQQVPNITNMANDEYLNDTQGLLANKGPVTRSVWVDTINGTSATDKIGGKVRPTYYTYQSDWMDGLTEYFSQVKMWDGKVTAKQACEGYASTFQAALDEMRADMGV